MKIELYYAPVACSLVPYVTLTEAGADFEVHTINLAKQGQKSPEFMRINPKHKVPLLVVDGKTLTENVAIQLWIARNFPEANLIPADPWLELQATSTLSWFASGVHPHLTRIFGPKGFCNIEGTQENVQQLAKAYLFEQFGIADKLLEGKEFLFDHFTAADAYFFWCFRRATLLKLDVSEFANCTKHFETMKARASVKKVLEFEADVQKRFAAE